MDVLLVLHLIGAAMTAIAACVALGARLPGVSRLRAESVAALVYAAAFQILSGVLLAARSPETNVWAVCQSLAAYLVLVALVLFACRALDHRLVIPRRPLGMFLASCGVLLSAAMIGL